MTETKVALCWYEPEEWQRLKQVAADKHVLDDSYEEWKSNANSAIKELQSQGQHVQKIAIKIHKLEIWCKAEGLENNMAARSRYVSVLHKERS